MIEGLEFDPETHRYLFEGKPFPSVTRVLRPLDDFGGVNAELLDFARQRGIAVHEATALDDQGILDEESVVPLIAGYLEGWRRFRRESGFECLEIELPVVHGRFEYAGTLDRVGVLNDKVVIIDIKTGERLPLSCGPQLAAYSEAYSWGVGAALLKRPPEMPRKRFGVQLREDGSYALHPYDSPEDWEEFRNLLSHFRWLEKYA
jgi:hypothetical protein